MVDDRSPAERALAARVAAHARWSKLTEDERAKATAPARAVRFEQFERQVDPDGKLRPEERARLAEAARKAHMARMSLASLQKRRGRRNRTKSTVDGAA